MFYKKLTTNKKVLDRLYCEKRIIRSGEERGYGIENIFIELLMLNIILQEESKECDLFALGYKFS